MTYAPYAGDGRGYTSCVVPSCDQPHYSRRLCETHYQAEYRERKRNGYTMKRVTLNDLTAVLDELGTTCNLPDCPNPTHARGLCQKHYVQYTRLTRKKV